MRKTLFRKDELDFADIMRFVSIAKNAAAIHTVRLSPSQVLELECLIKREFKRATGREIKWYTLWRVENTV